VGSGTGLVSTGDEESRIVISNAEPSSEELLDILCTHSAVPLSEVRKHATGRVYVDAQDNVLPRDPGVADRMDVGNPLMMAELAAVQPESAIEPRFPFRLIPRRCDEVYNSCNIVWRDVRKTSGNPAYMNPLDMKKFGVEAGTLIEIASRHGAVTAVAEPDKDLKRNVISMTHAFGSQPGEEADPMKTGTNVNYLLRMDDAYDAITGVPLMAAVPVAISVKSRVSVGDVA
jgi:anaerobic selenocysteine-containing dehydrogenase